MLKKLSQREQIANLLDQYSLAIRQAFLNAIAQITSTLTLSRIVDRLTAHDPNGVISALELDPAHFNPVVEKFLEAYRIAGAAESESGAGIVPFNQFDAQGESEVRSHTDTLISRIVDDAKSGLLTFLVSALAVGRSPRSIALWIVGPKSRVTGERTGGIIGLTSTQMAAVSAADSELAAGTREALESYMRRSGRNKRFDKALREAIASGNTPDAEFLAKVRNSYADNLRQLRAQMLGETEALTAINMGRYESVRQAQVRRGIAASELTKTWISRRDGRVRHTHIALDSQKVPFDGVFHSPSGATLRFPGDPLAPPEEIIHCRCHLAFDRVKR
jgi:hypothetical protein